MHLRKCEHVKDICSRVCVKACVCESVCMHVWLSCLLLFPNEDWWHPTLSILQHKLVILQLDHTSKHEEGSCDCTTTYKLCKLSTLANTLDALKNMPWHLRAGNKKQHLAYKTWHPTRQMVSKLKATLITAELKVERKCPMGNPPCTNPPSQYAEAANA